MTKVRISFKIPSPGEPKINVIKAVRQYTGMGLAAAKAAVEAGYVEAAESAAIPEFIQVLSGLVDNLAHTTNVGRGDTQLPSVKDSRIQLSITMNNILRKLLVRAVTVAQTIESKIP